MSHSDDDSPLEGALDFMHKAQELFVGEFEVQNFLARREGGQGLVQFMRRAADRIEYAVKFFHAPDVFERELELYNNPHLASILPALLAIRKNAERGESLNEWCSRVSPNFATTLWVLMHAAGRLAKLHAAGLCHRDVKPANLLWLPVSKSWTLIDFGCAATIGSTAPVLYSVQYAAPEVIAAACTGARMIIAAAAVDVWALGVLSYELLTRTRLMQPFAPSCDDLIAQLRGDAPLPWEDEQSAAELLPRLRGLKRSVLACLARDAAARPTAAEVLSQWRGLLGHHELASHTQLGRPAGAAVKV